LYQDVSLYHVVYHPKLCVTCLKEFAVVERSGIIFSYPIMIVYQYNAFFRKLLYQYKGLYDVALKDAFLDVFKEGFKKKYQEYLVVIAPSSENDTLVRGFNPNLEIVKTFSNSIFSGLYKQVEYKQTNQKDRSRVKEVIAIQDGDSIRHQKILLFDDVITSGYTLHACIRILQQYQPKSIEIVVLASNQISTIFNK
jgi:predicted amidophosphoribosyltransferase